MHKIKQSPPTVALASCVMIAEAILLLGGSFSWLRVAGVAITVGVVVLLMQKSRAAWVLAILVSASQIASCLLFSQPLWTLASATLVIVLLSLPSSRKFVWSSRVEPFDLFRETKGDDHPGARLWALPFRVVDSAARLTRYANSQVIAWLGCGLVVLLIVELLFDAWHKGSGANSVVVELLWQLSFAGVTIGLLVLGLLSVVALYRYLGRKADNPDDPKGRSGTVGR